MSVESTTSEPQRRGPGVLGRILVGAIVMIVLPSILCGVLYWWTYRDYHAAVSTALAALEKETEVMEKLGTPYELVETADMLSYEVEEGNGKCQVYYGVKGPKSGAIITANLECENHVFSLKEMTIVFSDEQIIRIPPLSGGEPVRRPVPQ